MATKQIQETLEIMNSETGEVLEVQQSTELAIRNHVDGVMIAGQKFEVIGLVNVPTLKHESGTTIAFTILAAIILGTNEKETTAIVDGVKRVITEQVPINVVRVYNLYDGLEYEYVLNAIAADSLKNAYPEHAYIGKSFAIKKGQVVQGKRYKEVEVIEIKPES